MKLVKPQMVGFLQQTLEVRAKFLCTFGVPLLFEIGPQATLLPEVELWRMLGSELPPDATFDPGVPKTQGEYIVIGEAFAPAGQSVSSCHVRTRVGPLEKLLFVSGDRRWLQGAPTAPEAFQSLPIVWPRAYGGPDFADNPVGKGHRPIALGGQAVHELPNVEDPRRPMRTLSDQPLPASFAPLDMLWPERARKRGTYDRAWMETRFPGLPDDFDWSFFNVAPADQRTPQSFTGSEPIRIENMHPSLPVLSGQLPGVRARGFIRRGNAAAELEEVELRLDTVWLFPKLARGVMVFHGAVEVTEDDSRDVHEAVFAVEALGVPKSVDHYRAALLRRADPEQGSIATLDDRDLMPDGFELPDYEPKDQPGAARNAKERATFERRIHEARALVVSHGLDPDEHAPRVPDPLPPPVTLETLPARLKEARETQARAEIENEEMKRARMADVKAKVEEAGLDWSVFEAEFSPDAPGGPPKFSAKGEIARLAKIADECRASGADMSELDGYLADPKFCSMMFSAEANMREGYRVAAHHLNPPRKLAPEEKELLRARVVAAHAAGESMEGWDLTGADLSGLTLREAKLAGAHLEAADLTDADLTGSDLSSAVLARANLTRTRLGGAALVQASFGGAKLANTSFGPENANGPGVDARSAIFAKAELTQVDLQNATLEQADFTDSKLAGTNLAGAKLGGTTFLRADLATSCLARANLHKATFLESTLEGTDFSDAVLTLTSFVDCAAKSANFAGADLNRSSFVLGCKLDGADFRGAKLGGSSLRQQQLRGANFSGALAPGADFSEARLEDAVFFRADAPDARFTRAVLDRTNFTSANLMTADFQKSQAHGTNFSRSNLFRADFGRTRFDRGTTFEGALLNQVKMLPKVNGG